MIKRFEINRDSGNILENNIYTITPSQLINIKCYLLCGLLFWLIIPLFLILWYYLVIKNSIYKLTSERLIIKKGVFNKYTEQIELYRVKDIRLEEPLLMRIFGLGNIILVTSDKTLNTITIPAIKNPKNLKDKIRRLSEHLRASRNIRELDVR